MARALSNGFSQLGHRLLGLSDLLQGRRSEKVNTLVGWLRLGNLIEMLQLFLHCLGCAKLEVASVSIRRWTPREILSSDCDGIVEIVGRCARVGQTPRARPATVDSTVQHGKDFAGEQAPAVVCAPWNQPSGTYISSPGRCTQCCGCCVSASAGNSLVT